MPVPPLAFSVQADPADVSSWSDLARRCEAEGFEALLVADHPGSGSAPFVALAAAATATTRLRLGSNVVNAGAREPLLLASDVATLDLLSGGRALFGVGAGHTPAEWTMRGVPYPSATARIERLVEVVEVVRRLLAGETVTYQGDHVTVVDAVLDQPRPVQSSVPLLIGGNAPTLLTYAARTADIVGLSGLGRTLDDGHRHEVRWHGTDIDARVELVRTTARDAGRDPALECLVQHVELTEDAHGAAERLAERVPTATADDILGAPYVLVGTAKQIADELRSHHARWGITRYVVRQPAMDAARQVMAALD